MEIKKHGRWILFNICAWSIGKVLFLAIKLWGIQSMTVRADHPEFSLLFLAIAISGLLDGLLLGLLDLLVDNIIGSAGFARRLFLKSILNLLVGVTLSMMLIPCMLRTLGSTTEHLLDQMLNPAQLMIMATYFLLLTLMVQFAKLTMFWMKTQDIFDLIANPHGMEEERIFLFLDMKSSTRLGESLEVAQYSRLLQECFKDLASAALETNGEIYQYVGDEAVLTWPQTAGNFLSSVEFYFRFCSKLAERREWYLKHVGAVPAFKAGIHHGKVIKAQVGLMHKEIAYHGDPINTASRIQSKCSELGQDLLISETMQEHIGRIYQCVRVGRFELRGKTAEMDLYSVHGHDQSFSSRFEPQSILGRLTQGTSGMIVYVQARLAKAFRLSYN